METKNTTLRSILQELDFSPKEQAIYIALLKAQEPLPASTISRLVGIPRQTTYDLLEGLIKKGAVAAVPSQGVRRYNAQGATQITAMLTTQQDALEEKKHKAEALTSLIAQLNSVKTILPHIRFFEGEKGIKAMFTEITKNYKSETLRVFATAQFSTYLGPKFFERYIQERAKQNIESRILVAADLDTEQYTTNTQLKRETRVARFEGISSNINVIEDTAYFFVFEGGSFALAVRNAHIVKLLKAIFDITWEASDM